MNEVESYIHITKHTNISLGVHLEKTKKQQLTSSIKPHKLSRAQCASMYNNTYTSGLPMKLSRFFFAFILLTLTGCMPKSPPLPALPELGITIEASQKLPFRICGLTFEIDKEQKENDNIAIVPMYFINLQNITRTILYNDELTSQNSDSSVSINIIVKQMHGGSREKSAQEPAILIAEYQATDISTGQIIFSKTYEAKQELNYEAYAYGTFVLSSRALYKCTNNISNQFVNDLISCSAKPLNYEKDKIHGSLQFVHTDIPLTTDLLRWLRYFNGSKYHGASRSQLEFMTQLLVTMPKKVTRKISSNKLFNYSPENNYIIEIVIPTIKTINFGLFKTGDDSFVADAVIYKNNIEVGSVEFDPSEYDASDPLDEIMDAYAVKIVNYMQTHIQRESK